MHSDGRLLVSIMTQSKKGVLMEQIALSIAKSGDISGTAAQIFNSTSVGAWPICFKKLPAK